MDVFAEYATDETKEEQGVWHPVGADGTELLIARSGNRKYSRLLAQAMDKHGRALDLKNEASDKLSETIMVDVLAESVLLGFKNVSYKKSPMSYSVVNARTLLGHKDFRQLVTRLSNDMEAYKVAVEAEAEKN